MYDNYNFPMGADTPQAPWNQPEVPEKEFQVACCQSLSKTVTVWTNNYIPGDSGIDYEPNGEGGYDTVGWHDKDDTSDTDWHSVYDNSHMTPLQLIKQFKETLEKQLESWEGMEDVNKREIQKIEYLIEECSDWIEDDLEIAEDEAS